MMAASVLALPSGQWQPACWLTHFNYDGSQRAGLPTSIRMVASVLAHTHCNYDGSQRAGSQRAGLPTSTMMVASVLALPSQQWQPACWLTHFNHDGSQRAGFPSGQWQPASWLPLPVVLIFQLPSYSAHYSYYTVANSQLLPTSHLPAPQLLRALKLYSSQLPAPQIAPRTTVVLQRHQF